jgi:phosphinothricin acetyltransferase
MTNENVSLVSAADGDVGEILSLYNHYVVNTTATFSITPFTEEDMRKILFFDDPKYRSFVIRSDGSMCGYGIISKYKKREAYDISAEVTIYLKPDMTGRGIGGQALLLLEEFARSSGIHSLVAVVTSENAPSVGLFTKNGYEKCAHYREIGYKFDRYLDIVCFQKILRQV